MAAGLGFKDFTTGEVLTAADVDGYLMQGIWVFANATARDAAVTSPQEGNFAFTKDNNSLWYYDGATWVASGATGDIEGVTAGVGISGGGTSGTVTITNSMATAIDAKGDLVAGTGADTFSRIAVGADATVLTADSSTATGLKWAAPSGGAGNLAEITSGSFSGSSLSVSSLSSYTTLTLFLNGVSFSSASTLRVRLNGSSSSVYRQTGGWISPSSATTIGRLQSTLKTSIELNDTNVGANFGGNSTNSYIVTLTNCKNTGFTEYTIQAFYFFNATLMYSIFQNGVFESSAAISSLAIDEAGSQNFSAGQYRIYGA
jgi:hypothetical protein